MEKSLEFWKNSRILYRFFLRDALSGLRAQLALRRRSARILLGSAAILVYAGYIAYNFVEAGTLQSGLAQQTSELMEHTVRMLVASLITMNFLFAVIVAVIVFLTFSLTPASMYVSRTMAFTASEVSIAQRMVKATLASVVFLLLFAVEASAISVVKTTIGALSGMVFLAYLVFMAAYVLTDLILSAVSLPKGKVGSLMLASAVCILVVGVVYSFFSLRYHVDYWLGTRALSIDGLILAAILTTLGILAIEISISGFAVFDLRSRDSRRYFGVPVASLGNPYIGFVAAAFLRNKLFLVLVGIDVISSLAIVVKLGFSESMSALAYVTGTFTLAAIRYADITQSTRPFLKALRWSSAKEALALIILYAALLTPAAFFSIAGGAGVGLVLSYAGLFLAAIIIGFLFPKSAGNANETAGVIALIVVLVLLALALEVRGLIILVDVLFLGALLSTMKHETERIQ